MNAINPAMATLTGGSIANYFKLVAAKRVRDSEVNPEASNSHEFNGTAPLRDFLGRVPFGRCKRLGCRFLYFNDELEQPLVADAQLTWYKPHKDPRRSEWRMYYDDTAIAGVRGAAAEDDLMVFAFSNEAPDSPEVPRRKSVVIQNTTAWVVVARSGSIVETEIRRLFGISAGLGIQLEFPRPPREELDFVGRQLLDGLGIRLQLPSDWELRLLNVFGAKMPDVVTFSNYARSTLQMDIRGDPDASLLAWWEREDMLYRVFDRALLRTPITAEFKRWKASGEVDVEALRSILMSSTQTSRSRAGSAFEHQLASIFREFGLHFDHRPRTRKQDIPDFLFPSLQLYEETDLTDHLTMLAAKTTCKERWSQVLHEAARITRKHLATTSGVIPPVQLERMEQSNLTLVLPKPRHSDLPNTKVKVITLREFIGLVADRQTKFGLSPKPLPTSVPGAGSPSRFRLTPRRTTKHS